MWMRSRKHPVAFWLLVVVAVLYVVARVEGARMGGSGEPEGDGCYEIEEEEGVYDYVVVGAGTAGAAAAAVLADALPSASILLLDQGHDHSDEAITMNNDQFPNIMHTPYCEHQYSNEPTLASTGGWTSKRDLYVCVSKILGGASAVNYGGWYRPPASDLDEWATVAQSNIWSYDAMLPIFARLEKVTSGPPLADRFYDGVVPVTHQNLSAVFARADVLPALQQHFNVSLGQQNNNGRLQQGINTLEVTRTTDGCWYDNDGTQLGCAANMRNGSSYNAFVRNPQRDGKLSNLVVKEGARVVKVDGIFLDSLGDPTVHYVQKGRNQQVTARHEILLSAGSWGNPKIAMLSGIGNRTELQQAGIDTKIDAPAVGRIKDHGVLWIRALLNKLPDLQAPSPPTTECRDTLQENSACTMGGLCNCDTLVNAPESTGCGGVYTNQWSNLQVNNLCAAYCNACPNPVERTTTAPPLDFSSFRGVDNPLPALLRDFNSFNFFFKSDEAQLEYPDFEFLGGLSPAGAGGFLPVRLYQNKGTSGASGGGHMRLRSDDPDEDMDVTRNFYADDDSIAPMLQALKKVLAFVQNLTDSHGAMLLEPSAFTVDFTDDDALKKYIRDNVVSEMHLMSSMRMGTQDNGAVVDHDLKIIGSNGRIRVADTSIFPDELRGHTMATAMAVGIKAADLIAAQAPVAFHTTTKATAAENGDAPSSRSSTTAVVAHGGWFVVIVAVALALVVS